MSLSLHHPDSRDITNPGPADPMIDALTRLATDARVPTERIVTLFELMERREKEMLRRQFMTDMNALQGEMAQIERDRPNPVFRSRYATLEQLDRVARPIYTKYGFSITYGTAPTNDPAALLLVTATVAHRGGYYEVHSLPGPVSTAGSQGGKAGATPIQAVGIAVKYLQRYLLQMVLNLVTANDPDDNDGNKATQDQGGSGDLPEAGKAFVDNFEAAMGRITDSDQAQALLNAKTGVRMITEMPHGALRQRYLSLRQQVTDTWIKQPASEKAEQKTVENAPENAGSDKGIEGLE